MRCRQGKGAARRHQRKFTRSVTDNSSFPARSSDPTEVAKVMKLLPTRYPNCSGLRQLPLLLQLGPDLEQAGGMFLVVCDCVDDGTAQHVKGIIFGIVDLQDPEG